MLEQLNWLPLAKRRKQQRLNLFYQIMNGEIGLSLPDHYHFTNKHTRQHHPFHLIIPPTNTTSFMTSYFPRTIQEWNLLSPPLIEVNSLVVFSNQSQNICNCVNCNLFKFVIVGSISNCCLPFPSKIINNLTQKLQNFICSLSR